MKHVKIEDFKALEERWCDVMQKQNSLEVLKQDNWKIVIDGMISRNVRDTELNLNFFRQFWEKIGGAEYSNLRDAWEKFRNTIDVSVP